MEQDQLTQLLTAIKTIADTQAKALDTLILTLTQLAARLEPLASVQEGLIAGFDGTVSRMETIVLAEAEIAKVMEEAMALIQEVAREREKQANHHL